METNTDMGLKDLDKLEELQRVQKRRTECTLDCLFLVITISGDVCTLDCLSLVIAISGDVCIISIFVLTTLERRLIEIEHKLSETYRAPPCYQIPNIVINNNIDGNKSETNIVIN
jgi:hypothetical protein